MAIVDPRYGWFVAELIEYQRDSYYGTLKRITKELIFEKCPTEKPQHLINQICVEFKTKRDDGSIDSDTGLKLYGTYDGYGNDFSYLKLYFERCSTSRLRQVLLSPTATCLPNSSFDSYASGVSVEVAVHDGYVDVAKPTFDFYNVKTKRKILANQKLVRGSQTRA